MDARRLQYLRAMDVDVWQRREMTCNEPAPSSLPRRVVESQTLATDIPIAEIPDDFASPISSASWTDIENAVRGCTRCGLHITRTQTVFGVGNRGADWMIIGEAPGAEEDRQGEPFVGRAGQLLNSMLKAIGLAREQVFIANILKCRPPNNRDPKPEEVACCMPYLHRQIELVNPRIIVCVGRIAAQNLLGTDTPIGKLRGKVHYLGAQRRQVIVTYHPAYLLRSPGEKRKAWADLQLALLTHKTVVNTPS